MVLKPPQISNENDVREVLQRKLTQAPVEQAAALLSLYELVQALHDSKTLDLLRGGASDDIIGHISSALSSPELIRSIRNLIALAQIMGNLDPKILDGLRYAVIEATDKNKQAGKPPSLWKIVKRADSENSLRALAVVTDILESFGRRLRPEPDRDGQ